MSTPYLKEPSDQLSDPRDLLVAYLDAYRSAALGKLDGLSEADLRRSVLPSGWTALELLQHLAFVERRWFRWGFLGERVEAPWGDNDAASGRWTVSPEHSVGSVQSLFLAECARSREIVAAAGLTDRARLGGRFVSPATQPTLSWIMFHVLQEYARHLGQLDVVRELIDGAVGE